MDWQKYPKSRKSVRTKQPQTLESKECPAFSEMGDGLCEAFFELEIRPHSRISLALERYAVAVYSR
jgi:hypothetical protein